MRGLPDGESSYDHAPRRENVSHRSNAGQTGRCRARPVRRPPAADVLDHFVGVGRADATTTGFGRNETLTDDTLAGFASQLDYRVFRVGDLLRLARNALHANAEKVGERLSVRHQP